MTEKMNLTQWLDYITGIHVKRIDMGLGRVRQLMDRLCAPDESDKKQPFKKPFVITVAGTNGKGSLVYALNQLLLDSGLQVAAYTSPHLYRFNERMLINGKMVSNDSLCQAFAAIEALRGDIVLSFFEFTTLAAFWLFRRYPLDLWILEVGLGGRLDAVNVIDPDIGVICSIDMDHQAWLGDNLPDIALEKSGIARANRPIIIFEKFPDKALNYLNKLGAQLHYPQPIPVLEAALDQHLGLQTLAQLAAVKQLLPWKIDDQQTIASMQKLRIPARKQYIQFYHREWLLDTAHNPAASRHLKDYVEHHFPDKTLYLIFACLADKDIEQIIDVWCDTARHWYLIDLEEHHRAIPKTQLLYQFTQKQQPFSLTAYSALDKRWQTFVRHLPQDGLIVVFGSFIHLGLIWHRLEGGGL